MVGNPNLIRVVNPTFTAYFKPDPNYKSINLYCDPAGAGTVSGGGLKKKGTQVTVTAAAAILLRH